MDLGEVPKAEGVGAGVILKDYSKMTTNTLIETTSLKKEKFYSLDDPILFTTGAYIQPLKVVDNKGNEKWFWVVSEFVDDTFLDGQVLNPRENGLTKDELFSN